MDSSWDEIYLIESSAVSSSLSVASKLLMSELSLGDTGRNVSKVSLSSDETLVLLNDTRASEQRRRVFFS